MLDRVVNSSSATDPRCGTVRGVSLSLGGHLRLDQIDLDIANSGCTVVMGPNGSGKSLFLRLLHSLIAPTKGTIVWGGVPAGEDTRKLQAMVFQKPILLRRSVAANIDYVLSPSDKRGGMRDALLARVGLEGRGRQAARVLSGGEQQRLALARALACRPSVLFLDEPTASLDPHSTLRIEQIVLEERKAGTKIIMVTHDVGQARRLADDIVFMRTGRIEEVAPVSAFFDAPKSPFARQFLAGELVL